VPRERDRRPAQQPGDRLDPRAGQKDHEGDDLHVVELASPAVIRDLGVRQRRHHVVARAAVSVTPAPRPRPARRNGTAS